MENLKSKKILYISIGIVVIFVCIIICFIMEQNNQSDSSFENDNLIVENENNLVEKTEMKENKIYVHIAGEVKNPGVVEINEGSRIKDIIEKAGGFTDTADYRKVNLAYQVEDGQKIVIPNINDENKNAEMNSADYIIQDDGGIVVQDVNLSNKKININTATQSELESLTGIGPSMASKIIQHRVSNGKFEKIEDIKNVPGIGNAKFEALKDEICVK